MVLEVKFKDFDKYAESLLGWKPEGEEEEALNQYKKVDESLMGFQNYQYNLNFGKTSSAALVRSDGG